MSFQVLAFILYYIILDFPLSNKTVSFEPNNLWKSVRGCKLQVAESFPGQTRAHGIIVM